MIYQEGNYYHIYNRGCNKENIFFSESDYKMLLSKIDQTKDKKKIEIIAYCLIPNHYHFLVHQNSEQAVSDWLKSLFSGYVQKVNRKYQRSGTLFERSAQPKLIAKDKYLVEIIHYIHTNPLKHGLVKNPVDWKYSSLTYYLEIRQNRLINDRVIKEYFSDGFSYKGSFQEYLEDKKFEN